MVASLCRLGTFAASLSFEASFAAVRGRARNVASRSVRMAGIIIFSSWRVGAVRVPGMLLLLGGKVKECCKFLGDAIRANQAHTFRFNAICIRGSLRQSSIRTSFFRIAGRDGR